MAKKRSKKSNARAKQARSKAALDWPLLILPGLGMVITAYLTSIIWLDAGPAMCSEGSSCDLIQSSRWSMVLGLPLALWGFFMYALMLLIAISTKAPTKRWQRLWLLSTGGLAISLYLTAVAWIELQAACLWCMTSLVIIAAIIARLLWRRPTANKSPLWWYWPLNTTVLALVAVSLLHVYYYSDILQPVPSEKLEALAEHLDQSGAKFYGASWCLHCQQQKRMFRQAADQLPYIECSPAGQGGPLARVCSQENINNYPTWVINNQRHEGILKPGELARRSGFDW